MVKLKKGNKPESGKTTGESKYHRVDPSKGFDAVLDVASRCFGKGVLFFGEDDSGKVKQVDVIPTGSFKLDKALGVGGVPRGRIVEVYGPEGGGKTTVSLSIIHNAQQMGLKAAFIDAEHALDPNLAKSMGVNMRELLVSQPDSAEQALEIIEMLVMSGSLAVVVLDSVAALVPKAELEGEMGEAHMGLQARLMSQALRKLVAVTAKSNTTVIFINQLRQKIGVFFGSPDVTTGGKALKFYSSVRLDVRTSSHIKNGEDVIGNNTKIIVVKNKLAPPYKTVETELYFGKGFNRTAELLDCAIDAGIVEKNGSWLSYNGERLGLGRAAALEILTTNSGIFTKVESEVLALQAPAKIGKDEDDKESTEDLVEQKDE